MMARVHSASTVRAAGPDAHQAGGDATRGVTRRVLWVAFAIAAACGAPPRAPGTVVIASGADLEGMNPLATVHPLSRQVQRYALFVTLLRPDSALAAQPYFAQRWQWSPDRRALTLTTAAGVRWADGTPTTARDAAFTIDAARDPVTGYARAGELASITNVAATDDSTLVLRFLTRQPTEPAILAELPLAPAHLLRDVPRAELRRSAFALQPVGNGPFAFVERRAGQRWVFARNPDFPAVLGGPPNIRRLVIAVVDEPATKFAGLVGGELDVAGIAPGMATLAARDPSLHALSYPVLFTHTLVFNPSRPPFDDVRVRRALSLSIDRERLVSLALAAQGAPARGPVPLGHPFAAAFAIPRHANDVMRADSLLSAAGWLRGADGVRARGGRSLAFELLCVGSGDNLMEQLIQADLSARGIRADIRTRELGAFLAEARATPRRFDALVTGIPGDIALGYLGAMFDGRQRGGALDYANWHTALLDQRFADVRTAASPDALRQAWISVQSELDVEAPVAWLVHARGLQGITRRLSGVEMDLRGELATVGRWRVAP